MYIAEKKINEAQLRELLPHAVLLHRTDEQTRDEWVQERTRSIGASNVAAMLGVSPWCTELELARIKRGDFIVGETRAMERGTRMEPLIRAWAEEDTDCRIYTVPWLMQNPRVPVLTANLDGLGVLDDGRPFVCELKDSSYGMDVYEHIAREGVPPRESVGSAPYQYWLQVQSQMAIAGVDFALFGVAVGSELHTYWWNAHPETQQYIEAVAAEWWDRHIVQGIDPQARGADIALLRSMCPPEEGAEPVDLSDNEEALAALDAFEAARAERLALEKDIKEIKERENDARAKLEQMMGDAPVALLGEREATRKASERKGYTVEPGITVRFSTRKAKKR
jgi:putative phage-type endonuclease